MTPRTQLDRATAAVEPSATAGNAVSTLDRSIDDLDAAICRLARQMYAETYRMLLLVRDFDDRFGFAKWGFPSCAEWLAWRCGLSLSAAREGAHRSSVAELAGDLGRVRGWAVVVFEGESAHAGRGQS